MPTTLISYIQSRGRARHASSKYILIGREGDQTVQERLFELQEAEKEMHQVLLLNNDREVDEEIEEDFMEDGESVYVVKATGAVVTLNNSIAMVNHYISLLPRDRYYIPRIQYEYIMEGGLCARIHMPRTVRADCRELLSDPCDSRRTAKKQAAFQMVKLLHRLGELDDSLKSVMVSKLRLGNTGQVRIGKLTKIRSYVLNVPSILEGSITETKSMWVNAIRTRKINQDWKFMSVGFLTFKKLPSEMNEKFPYDIQLETKEMQICSFSCRLEMNDELQSKLSAFHLLFFKSLIRSEFDESTNWATLAVPFTERFVHKTELTCDDNHLESIDWACLQRCLHDDVSEIDPSSTQEEMRNLLVYDPYRWKRTYFLEAIHEDMNPMVTVVENSKEIHLKTLYQTLFRCKDDIDETQPLISATHIGYPYCTFRKSKNFPTVLLIPELCVVLPIRHFHLKDGLSMPVIWQYIYHRMMANDIINCVPFGTRDRLDASLNNMTIALTAPNAGLEYDYERLETLGDSFLKMFLAVHCFVKHPHAHEGFMSVSRMYFENNQYLRNRSNELKLEGYIHSIPYDRRTWMPPTQFNIKKTHNLSDKSVADVVEAILGACVLEDTDKATLAAQLLIGSPMECSWERYILEWNVTQSEEIYFDLEHSTLKSIGEIEDKIGYRFKNPRYMAEALTHSSATGLVNSLERLEYLGDAVLGFVVTQFIFALRPELDPGKMTGLKGELVGNQFLACVSLSLCLPNYMNHMVEDLGKGSN